MLFFGELFPSGGELEEKRKREGGGYISWGGIQFQELSVEGILRLSEKWLGILRICRDFVSFLGEC